MKKIRFTKPALVFILSMSATFLFVMGWLVAELFDISFGEFL